MNSTVITANNHIKRDGIDHGESMNFRRSLNPGTEEDFIREMNIFYPDKDGHFKGLNT